MGRVAFEPAGLSAQVGIHGSGTTSRRRQVLALETCEWSGLRQRYGGLVDDSRAYKSEASDHERGISLLGVDELSQAYGAAGTRHVHDLNTRDDFLAVMISCVALAS